MRRFVLFLVLPGKDWVCAFILTVIYNMLSDIITYTTLLILSSHLSSMFQVVSFHKVFQTNILYVFLFIGSAVYMYLEDVLCIYLPYYLLPSRASGFSVMFPKANSAVVT
jgi:hypothetical protein